MCVRHVYRVVPAAARWVVRSAGVERPVADCPSKPEAVRRARAMAKVHVGDACVVVCRRDGTVQAEHTHDWAMPGW